MSQFAPHEARKYTEFADKDTVARQLVDVIADSSITVQRYRDTMVELGRALASKFILKIDKFSTDDLFVICTVEDADFLARGVIEQLDLSGLGNRIKLMCMWNESVQDEGISLSPVLRQYREEPTSTKASFIVVKSIISGACVVKTNLTRAISSSDPQQVFVVSPVLYVGAQERLALEFPPKIAEKFEYYWFATDSNKSGEDVVPGIGGRVYERLGFGNEANKNKFTPQIVRQRRKLQGAYALAATG